MTTHSKGKILPLPYHLTLGFMVVRMKYFDGKMSPIASFFAFSFPFQVYCAQRQQTNVYHLRAAMVPHVLTIWVTMCACAPKGQFGTWAKTVMSCMMPVSWHHAQTAPASLGLTISPATAQMALQGPTALRMWMNVKAILAKASGPIV